MLNRIGLLAVGVTLGFGAMTSTGTGASAAATMPLAPQDSSQADVAGAGVVQVADRRSDRRMRSDWDGRRDGNRCSRRSNNCRHFHNGFYYQSPWWTLPLIVGGAIANNNDGGNYGSRHVEWCSERYRSYNPRYNTWVSYSGQVNQCNSPY